MNLEKFSGVFLIAGLVLFVIAIVGLAGVPIFMVESTSPSAGMPAEVPTEFVAHYDSLESYHRGLLRGRDLYIREACWHCHSQYVRPTANENLRYGPVSSAGEYQGPLHLPQLFGTRRVGPDLIRESGRKSNDWHYAHLYQPTSVVPQSVMPSYPWLFETREGVPSPTKDAVALVAYLQNLGSDVRDRKESTRDYDQQTLPPKN